MTRVFSIITIMVSLYMIGAVFCDINHNVHMYAQQYSFLTQVVIVTKIMFTNLIVVVLSLFLFKRR